jgi:RNA polymerase sigma-70 factor (ECF subfamily)
MNPADAQRNRDAVGATPSCHPSGGATDDAATEAFLAKLMAHRHRICAFLAKQLVNPADVEDVFQRTSVILWRKMDVFDPDGSFFHWACGIAYNEVRNFLTVRRRDRLYFDGELIEMLAKEAEDEEETSEARLNALRKCVATLSDRQQAILRRCYSGVASITAAADGLGQTRGALYKQLARLREKLLNCIRLRLAQEGLADGRR